MVFDKKEYMKEYRENNREHLKEYNKEYHENNKEYFKEYDKKRYENNKEYFKEKMKEYIQTEQGQMNHKIKGWKSRGIIYDDMEELYYIFKMTEYCNYCWCPLVEGNYGANRKCLDHDHETGEPRGVICHTCNVRDVFKDC